MAGFTSTTVEEFKYSPKNTNINIDNNTYLNSNPSLPNGAENNNNSDEVDFSGFFTSKEKTGNSTTSYNNSSYDEEVMRNIDDEIDRLEHEMERIGKDDPRYPALEAELNGLLEKKHEMEQKDGDVVAKEKLLESMKDEVVDLEKKYSELDKQLDNERALVRENLNMAENVINENDARRYREEAHMHQLKADEIEEKKKELERDINEKKKEIERLEYELNNSSSSDYKAELKRRYDDLNQNRSNLDSEIKAERDKLANLENLMFYDDGTVNEAISREVERVRKTIDNLEKEKRLVEQEMEDIEIQMSKLDDDLDNDGPTGGSTGWLPTEEASGGNPSSGGPTGGSSSGNPSSGGPTEGSSSGSYSGGSNSGLPTEESFGSSSNK